MEKRDFAKYWTAQQHCFFQANMIAEVDFDNIGFIDFAVYMFLFSVFWIKSNLKKSPMTMTMTTTAAQELLRGDAQIEAPPVGGRMREASATSAHLHSLLFVILVGGPQIQCSQLDPTKSPLHMASIWFSNVHFETIQVEYRKMPDKQISFNKKCSQLDPNKSFT